MGTARILGIDVGSESIKCVELERVDGQLVWTRRELREHNKEPEAVLRQTLADWNYDAFDCAAVTGRLGRLVKLERVPTKQAQTAAFKHLFPGVEPATVVSIGSHGFSVLEIRSGQNDLEVFRENSRCSQGTGNFLRQLVERFNLSIEEASELCAEMDQPAPLSGRCPVILKTDMTHLANKGESQAGILAGLYDAVCENVQVLIKPRISPRTTVLIGGVSRSKRIRDNFRGFLTRNEMDLVETQGDDALYFDALGAALTAAEKSTSGPAFADLFSSPEADHLDRLPPLSTYLTKVKRLESKPVGNAAEDAQCVVIGYDIGSTGSKAVALDPNNNQPLWEGYINTNGAPIKAAQDLTRQFTESPISHLPVVAIGATGSGREIVGSLMTTCYGSDSVFVLNEIAAHAEGALHFDPRVDTIFEIGGQDAKYIRLADGRVVDAAMNEACSAGTGSFIEEQGRKFSGVKNVVHLGETALDAGGGVSLGQHCSVFMAEVIDEAVASGVAQGTIIAGIYDSIISNYLNRVKGSRSVGQYVFCQGMPFASDALATAVVRQTGAEVIVPPNPGTVGALGIALLTSKEKSLAELETMDLQRFMSAEVREKDVFVCKSTKGCGEPGNKCRIDRIKTVVDDQRQNFTWGGGCSLYDKGTGKRKLPDKAPDPFREREQLVAELVRSLAPVPGRPTVAVTDEFVLKGLAPFFATYLHAIGFNLDFHTGADHEVLKRGIEDAHVPFCAPMQQYHGLINQMSETEADYLFLPMLRQIPRVKKERWARLCPIVQGSADILKTDLGKTSCRIISPVINVGPDSLLSQVFRDSVRELAEELGVSGDRWEDAYKRAVAQQELFDQRCLELGRLALEFCERHHITPVVVLGRAYTIYNNVLNSNVPIILREQGSIAIPVDCYPVDDDVPIFERMYWGYGQRNLRAAYQIRRSEGIYSLYCSNYSCGPDSFNIHFFGHLMEGKPYAIIETDGHSGDAGTKTRVEAFLYCVSEDLRREHPDSLPASGHQLQDQQVEVSAFKDNQTILIPRMGVGAEALAACLNGIGYRAEALDKPNQAILEIGRRHTSGKECVPMILTLGSLLERVERPEDSENRFIFFMPMANGPCRFGSYHVLHKMVLERLGLDKRVRVWSPVDENYFGPVPEGFAGLVLSGFVAADMLLQMLYDTRSVETEDGSANETYDFYRGKLLSLLGTVSKGDLSNGTVTTQVLSGHLFGIPALISRAARAFKAIKSEREVPTVEVVGEIYVRCDPAANDHLIEKLEERGIRPHFAVFSEWIEYTDYQAATRKKLPDYVNSYMKAAIQNQLYTAASSIMDWPERTTVQDSIKAASPYIREQLSGEAVLTVGEPIHEWREGHIDGVISVGPLECMPNKIAESQFFHVAEREGLLSLTLNLNGEPINRDVLDNFAFEVKSRFHKKRTGKSLPPPPIRPRAVRWKPVSRVNRHE